MQKNLDLGEFTIRTYPGNPILISFTYCGQSDQLDTDVADLIEGDARFSCGLFDDANDDDKRAFAAFRVRAYSARPRWKRNTLSKYFADDFAGLTADDFKIIDADASRKI